MRGCGPLAHVKLYNFRRRPSRKKLMSSAIPFVIDRKRPDLDDWAFAVINNLPYPEASETVKFYADHTAA